MYHHHATKCMPGELDVVVSRDQLQPALALEGSALIGVSPVVSVSIKPSLSDAYDDGRKEFHSSKHG